ncbi:hypothetical protein Dsi01nite_041380 [Dactylosporangium siamense]|uniref:Uncharacterized protein n=1 Tax=Dactylosporangium siamense TaxID=685454 RepID=A0A919PM20_9ACTN|nr:hypothetical protein Dsi01nite_041380 [Dactylosporangium siamense]
MNLVLSPIPPPCRTRPAQVLPTAHPMSHCVQTSPTRHLDLSFRNHLWEERELGQTGRVDGWDLAAHRLADPRQAMTWVGRHVDVAGRPWLLQLAAYSPQTGQVLAESVSQGSASGRVGRVQ